VTKSQADRKRECRTEVLEALVELYLRLNGYFCIRNYLYHRKKNDPEGLRAESDLLSVRLPHQREALPDGTIQKNDANIILDDGRIDCLIVEVKEGVVAFNKSVTNDNGWKTILCAIEMFGVLPPNDPSDKGPGAVIARSLHEQIRSQSWPAIASADSGEGNAVSVRMPVFARSSAKQATKRKFISLEHTLEFVRNRMSPGQTCRDYYRGEKFSPWRGPTRQIVDFLDRSYKEQKEVTVDLLLANLCL
jgi:hypothetical protein